MIDSLLMVIEQYKIYGSLACVPFIQLLFSG